MENKIINEIRNVHSVAELDALKENFEKEYESWKEVLKLSENIVEAKAKNFGYIKDLMEVATPALIGSKPEVVREYVQTVKASPALKNLFFLYENMEGVNEKTDFQGLIKEWKNMAGKCSKKKLSEERKKLEKIVCEAYAACPDWKKGDFSKEDRERYYNLVENVYTTTPSPVNMAQYHNDIAELKEIVLNQNKEIREAKELKENIINAHEEGTPTAESFDMHKNICVNKLSEIKERFLKEGDNDSAEKLDSYISTVSQKEYNSSTITEDINNFINLQNCFL